MLNKMDNNLSIGNKSHQTVAAEIISHLLQQIRQKETVYILSVAGESGSGKTETGAALYQKLEQTGIKALVLNQDNYFHYPPAQNDAHRKSDQHWLGPHAEVNMDLLQQNINNALAGAQEIEVPSIDYHANTKISLRLSLTGIRVLILEGTYVSLLKNIDARIFITSTYIDTLPYRRKRNRGNEVNDPFVENILATEHKIIAGHRYLADYLVSPKLEVTKTQ